MTVGSPAAGTALTRALCVVVLLLMVVAAAYAAYICVINYSHIHV
jgi:hypothetical protein